MRDFKNTKSFGKKGFGSDRPTEMHQATCNSCHKLCDVPFRPNGKKPIYCRDCFKSQEAAPAYARPNRTESFRREEGGAGDMKKELSILNSKIDRLITAIETQTQALSSSRN